MDYIFPLLVLALIFSPKLVREVKDYLLKKEQIKADTELRAEALRLKNSLDLEKFIENSNNEATYNQRNQNRHNNTNIQGNPNINTDINDESFDGVSRKRSSEYE